MKLAGLVRFQMAKIGVGMEASLVRAKRGNCCIEPRDSGRGVADCWSLQFPRSLDTGGESPTLQHLREITPLQIPADREGHHGAHSRGHGHCQRVRQMVTDLCQVPVAYLLVRLGKKAV